MHLTKLLLAAFSIFTATGLASAAALVEYTFADALPNPATAQLTAPSAQLPGISATSLTGTNLNVFSYLRSGENNTLAASPGLGQATLSLSQTLVNATYFSFTVTPDEGSSISLESLSFDARSGGDTGPRAFYVLSSVDGYTEGALLLSDNRGGGGSLGTTMTRYSIDLSSIAYQGLNSPVTFRFYVQSPLNSQTLVFDNLTLSGTVSAIPEPASIAAMAGLAALLLVACRRRIR